MTPECKNIILILLSLGILGINQCESFSNKTTNQTAFSQFFFFVRLYLASINDTRILETAARCDQTQFNRKRNDTKML